VHRDGRIGVRNVRTRAEATADVAQVLRDCVARRERVLLGFDFPYGYPAGFADTAFPGDGRAWRRIWAGLSSAIVDDERNRSNRFDAAGALPGPFWGSLSGVAVPARKPPFVAGGLPEYRRTELEVRRRGLSPKSVWQLSGAGSVGSQALVGIPRVRELRDHPELAAVSRVWPFETGFRLPEGALVVHAEIWPAVGTASARPGEVKDEAQVRAIVEAWAAADECGELARCFDPPAGLTPADLAAAEREEGWILGA